MLQSLSECITIESTNQHQRHMVGGTKTEKLVKPETLPYPVSQIDN